MEKEGSLVWLNCEWLLAHHYKSKLIPKKKKGKKKEKKKKKEKGKQWKTKNIQSPFYLWEIVLLVPNNKLTKIIIKKGHDQKNSADNEYEGK